MLGHVLDRYGHQVDPEVGAFVGVPNRHQLDFHVAADSRAIPALNTLAAFTAAGYRDSAGGVSPNVYWWRPSGLRRISTLTPMALGSKSTPNCSLCLRRLRGADAEQTW